MRLPDAARPVGSSTNRPGKDDLDFGETVRSFRVGQKVFHRYTLRRILGRGGMGVVWLAHDEKLAQEMALKFIPEVVRLDAMAVEELKSETRRSLQLTHPNIVRIYDFVDDEETAAIAMEYVDGPSLSLLRAQRDPHAFRVDEIAAWVRQLCEALHYAHQDAKVAHRDIKPANLLTNSQRQLKVADFGIARHLCDTMSRISHHTGPSGTLIYMSPQQLEGDHPSPQDDIYAVGATIYELLTSRTPFYSGDIARQVLNKIPPSMAQRRRELQLPLTDAIPDAWEEVVAACLAKDPAQRPACGGDIIERLGLSAGRSSARPPAPKAAEWGAGAAEAATIIVPELPPSAGAIRTARTSPPAKAVPAEQTVQLPPPPVPPAEPSLVRADSTARRNPWMWVALAALAVLLLAGIWMIVGASKRGAGPKDGSAAKSTPTNLAATATTPPPATLPVQPQPAPPPAKQEATPSVVSTAIPAPTPATPPAKPAEALVVKPADRLKGEVLLRVTPAGATVSLGSSSVTATGAEPVIFKDLAPGSYTVQVACDGYEAVKDTAKVTAGERMDLGTIALKRRTGGIKITSDPPGASYVLAGITPDAPTWTGTTPKTERDLPVGDYLLTFRYRDLAQKELRPHVAAGGSEEAHVKFEYGKLTVTSNPGGATVRANDRELGITPYAVEAIKPGRVAYTVQMTGYKAKVVEGDVTPGKPLNLHANLEPSAQAPNPLDIPPPTPVARVQPPPANTPAKAADTEPDLSSNNPTPKPVVAKPAGPAGTKSVFDLLAEGNRHVPESSSNLVTHAEGKKGRPGQPFPQEWTAYYYDQKLTLKLRQVTFIDGRVADSGASTDPFNPKTPHPWEQLKVDAPEAMTIIQKQLPPSTAISSSQWELRRIKGSIIVWTVKVWVAHPRNPRAEIGLGEISVSTQDGQVIENRLNLRAIR